MYSVLNAQYVMSHDMTFYLPTATKYTLLNAEISLSTVIGVFNANFCLYFTVTYCADKLMVNMH